MSVAQLDPDFEIYESGSTGSGFDTQGIASDMTAVLARVAIGVPPATMAQKIQHADVDTSEDYVDHDAPAVFFGDSAVVLLLRSKTKRFVRMVTQATGDDTRFVAGGILTY